MLVLNRTLAVLPVWTPIGCLAKAGYPLVVDAFVDPVEDFTAKRDHYPCDTNTDYGDLFAIAQ